MHKNTFQSTFPLVAALLLLFCFNRSFAQLPKPVNNSIDVILQSINMMDSGKYNEAITKLTTISPNDSNYALSLTEQSTIHQINGEDSIAIALCNTAIAEHTAYEVSLYKIKTMSMINLSQYKAVIALLKDTILVKYPNIYYLNDVLGLAYYKDHQFDKAIETYQKSIALNLTDATAHYYLGRACIEQGRLTPALLALNFYLLIEPGRKKTLGTVQLIDKIESNDYEYDKHYIADPSTYHDDVFADIDALIKSQVALKKDYKTKLKVTYNVVKQLQLLLEKLEYTPNSQNYWMDTYVPFFVDLYKHDYYEPYAYSMLQTVNDEGLQKDISKNKKKIDEFSKWADDKLTAMQKTKQITIDGQPTTVTCYYTNNGLLDSQGKEINGKKTGQWKEYNHTNGTLFGIGGYNTNGNKNGEWRYYYYNSQLEEIVNYTDGKREGIIKTWYLSGARKGVYDMKNDKLNGESTSYSINDKPSYTTFYKDDNLITSYTGFYPDSIIKAFHVYNNDGKRDGEQKDFYTSGILKTLSYYKNGKKDGKWLDYWGSGKIKDEGYYSNDKATGKWKFYYVNGVLQDSGNYVNDETDGLWKYYSYQGQLTGETEYKDGKADGDAVSYDDGKKFEEQLDKSDAIIHLKYFDKTGKQTFDTNYSGKKDSIKFYFSNGVLKGRGKTVNGKRTGFWRFYTKNGTLDETCNYKDGSLEGLFCIYYENGNLKDSLLYTDGKRNGYYIKYHINGKKELEGWYIDDNKEGTWINYAWGGMKSAEHFYHYGTEQGQTVYYDVNEKIAETDLFKAGYIDNVRIYDTTGTKVYFSYDSKYGNGYFHLPWVNNKKRVERQYIAGSHEGMQRTYYFNDSIASEVNYINGYREGLNKEYYSGGKMQSQTNYFLGSRTGEGKWYYTNGKLETDCSYLDGDLDGSYKQYHDNGSLAYSGEYVNGNSEGEFRFYGRDSSCYLIQYYKEGKVIGYSYLGKDGQPVTMIPLEKGSGHVICYFPNGKKSFECTFTNGLLNGKRISYYPDGSISYEQNLEWNNDEGIEKYYYRNGKFSSEENYVGDDKDGISKFYYDTGKLRCTETWKAGKQHGKTVYYDKNGKITKTIIYYNGVVIAQS